MSVTMSERSLYATRAIEYVADTISGLPFVAGNAVSRMPRPTTQMQQLLGPAPGGPNPQWSSAKLWNYSIKQYMVLGKFAWLPEYDDAGRIVALWPLMAQYLIPVVAEPNSKLGYFKEFEYGTRGAAGHRIFKPDQIVYIWRPSQHDVRQPEAPLRLATMGIVISQLLDQFDRSFLQSGGVPAHMVITPPFETAAERNAFRNQFNRKFGGASNAGKTMFSETDTEPGEYGTTPAQSSVDIKVIGQSQKDSELNVMRLARIDDIVAVFGVALSLLGISKDSKYTNMQTDRQNYWQGRGISTIRELQDHVNIALGPLMDGPKDVGWFDTGSVPELRGTPRFSEAGGAAAVIAGLITLNQYLEDRGLPRSDDPDADTLRKPAAVPAQLPNPPADPAVAPADPVAEPKRVAAVRTDLLGVVRDQLAIELRAQRGEIEARLAGKRGGRKKAAAQLDLGMAYEAEHWHNRMILNLTPTLRAAGFADHDISSWSEDITGRVANELHTSGVIGDIFEPDDYMASLTPHVHSSEVEQALMQVHAGQPVDAVLKLLT